MQIGLYEVGDSIPRVSHVPILEEDGAPTPLDLEDALPLTSLLASVAEQKDAIAAAIDTLQAQPFELSPGECPSAHLSTIRSPIHIPSPPVTCLPISLPLIAHPYTLPATC